MTPDTEDALRARIRDLTQELAQAKAEGTYAQIAREAMAELRERTERAEDVAMAMPEYLTIAQVSEYLGVSKGVLQKLRQSGNGPAFTRLWSRCYRYERSAVDRWMRTHARKR